MLARYLNSSVQIPTAVDVRVQADSGGLISARGLMAQRMVDTPVEAFLPILEQFEAGTIGQRLEKVLTPEGLSETLGLPRLQVGETRPLRFQCRCTHERTLRVLHTLSPEELAAILNGEKQQAVTCHMCGQTYTASETDLQSILAEKQSPARGTPPVTD
jgi:molecular chaperone Hsp33